MAAGLKISADRVESFRAAFESRAAELISAEALTPALKIDAQVSLSALSVPLVQQIESMAPFGAGNPPVIVAAINATMHAPPRRIGARGNTLQLVLTCPGGPVRCVGFGMGGLADKLARYRQIDVAGEPVINRYNGRESVEMHLKDVRVV